MLTVEDLSHGAYHSVVIATPDHQGRPVGRQVPVRRFLDHPDEGVDISSYALIYDVVGIPLFDSPFAGPHSGYHDIRLRPDLTTLRPYPGSPGIAICLADVVDAEGMEVPFAPRSILRRQIGVARDRGYDVALATELEFYCFFDELRAARRKEFRGLEPTTPERSTYGIVASTALQPFLQAIFDSMTCAGIPVSSAQTEAGKGQWEVNLPHTDPLQAADWTLLFKACVKELALRAGLTVTFMARPVPEDLGSSCHIHCSLWEDGLPLFPACPGASELSRVGRHFVGGLLDHIDSTAIFFAPYTNSYKRHAPGFAAGQVTAWGEDNRSVAVRVAGRGDSLRLEHRFPGADANPYLAAAAIIAAGLDGVDRAREPAPPAVGDADAQTELPRPPRSLGDALSAFEGSPFVAAMLGEDVARHCAAHARAEWEASLSAVTDWEINRNFEAV